MLTYAGEKFMFQHILFRMQDTCESEKHDGNFNYLSHRQCH